MTVTVVLENFTDSCVTMTFWNNRLDREVALNLLNGPDGSLRVYTQDGDETAVSVLVLDAITAADFFDCFDQYMGWDFTSKLEQCRGYVREDGTVVK